MKIKLPWSKPKDNWWILAGSIILAQLTGIIGSAFTLPAISTWYATLIKPFFSPPNWLFGPVWTILYTFMGVAAYLVWRRYQFSHKAQGFWHVYLAQLTLNLLWSYLFFGLKFTGLAFIEIMAMWYFIARCIQEGRKLTLPVVYLFLPYLAWVSFAALLNFAVFMLN